MHICTCSFICSPGKDGCGVECFGCEGLYNHAYAYAGNLYVCAVLEKGSKCRITLTPQAKGLFTLSSCQKTTAPSVSKPDPTANLHTPTSLTWVISMAIRALRASAATANYMSLTGTFFFKFFCRLKKIKNHHVNCVYRESQIYSS